MIAPQEGERDRCRRVLQLAQWLVPRAAQRRWRAEWEAELWAVRGAAGEREAFRFVLGALPDAFTLLVLSALRQLDRGARWIADRPSAFLVGALGTGLLLGVTLGVVVSLLDMASLVGGEVPLVRVWSPHSGGALSLDEAHRLDRAVARVSWTLTREAVLEPGGAPVMVEVARVSPDFFELAKPSLALGGSWAGRTDVLDSVLLTRELWQGCGRPPLGTRLLIDGEARILRGVLDSSFGVPSRTTDAWLPTEQALLHRPAARLLLASFARVRSADLEALRGELVVESLRVGRRSSRARLLLLVGVAAATIVSLVWTSLVGMAWRSWGRTRWLPVFAGWVLALGVALPLATLGRGLLVGWGLRGPAPADASPDALGPVVVAALVGLFATAGIRPVAASIRKRIRGMGSKLGGFVAGLAGGLALLALLGHAVARQVPSGFPLEGLWTARATPAFLGEAVAPDLPPGFGRIDFAPFSRRGNPRASFTFGGERSPRSMIVRRLDATAAWHLGFPSPRSADVPGARINETGAAMLSSAELNAGALRLHGETWQLVSVVPEVQLFDVEDSPSPVVYLPWDETQSPLGGFDLLFRPRGDPSAAVRTLAQGAPSWSFSSVRPLDHDRLLRLRWRLVVATAAGVLALLAAVTTIFAAILRPGSMRSVWQSVGLGLLTALGLSFLPGASGLVVRAIVPIGVLLVLSLAVVLSGSLAWRTSRQP